MIDKVILNGSTEVVDITGSKKNYQAGGCLRSTDAGIGNFRIYPNPFPTNTTYYTIGVYNMTQDRYECSHFMVYSNGINIQAAGTVLPLQSKSGIDRILYGDLVTTGSEDQLDRCVEIKKRSNSNYSGFTMTTSDWWALPNATDIRFESLQTPSTVKASEAIAADEVDMYINTTAQQVTDSQGYEDYYKVNRTHALVVDKGTTGTQTTKTDELFRFDAKDFRYNNTKGLQAKDKSYTSGYMVEEQATKRFTLTPSQTGWEGETIVNVTPESGSFVIDGFVMEMGKPTESWANGRIMFYNNAEASGESMLDLDIMYQNFDGRTDYRVNTYYAGTPYDYSVLPGEHAYIPLPTTFTVSQSSPLYLKISSESNSWLSAGGYSGSKSISMTTSAWQTSVDMTLRGFDDQEDVTASGLVDLKYTKQDTLVSGTNIKTVNGNSLLGSGNIVISGGGGGGGDINSITMNGSAVPVNAGVADLGTVVTDKSDKQDTLVSGTNIKTINNESILGSGNITIQGGGTQQQVDWNQSDSAAVDYIKNKPTIPTVPTTVSSFTNDAGYITSAALSSYYTKTEIDAMIGNINTLLAAI